MPTDNPIMFYRIGINQTIEELKLYFEITDREIFEKFVGFDKLKYDNRLLETKIKHHAKKREFTGVE